VTRTVQRREARRTEPGRRGSAAASLGTVAIGTSGWSYRHWRDRFYPRDLPASRWLPFYAERFDTVEINATFYRLPTEAAVRRWRNAAPPGFTFSVKGSRLITHARRLQNADRGLATFFERVSLLGDRLGCVLWQLPPGFVPELDVLDRFLASVPGDVRHAVELRRVDEPAPELLSLLEEHGASYVCTSSSAAPADRRVTSDLVYVRFHGLSGGFAHSYTAAELRPWASFLRKACEEGRSVLVYFNNDADGRAPEDAVKLSALL
jgi:uncharacterized protein YecE (DUF72 family)